ncbi:MAG TPA: hypothetical protein VMH87_02080 [Pseudomonadales bacterium]|nr:hypothetical protein [Pseudomonadales bacterium]
MKSFIAILALVALTTLSASAQSYSINWYKVAGGGGTSSGGQYSVSGTIGQPDASSAMTGGNYSLTGGFWALISVIQTPGGPTLYISYSPNAVTVYWQNVSGWTLHQNSNLNLPANWTLNSSWTTSNGTNYLQVVAPQGNEFYRLSNP